MPSKSDPVPCTNTLLPKGILSGAEQINSVGYPIQVLPIASVKVVVEEVVETPEVSESEE